LVSASNAAVADGRDSRLSGSSVRYPLAGIRELLICRDCGLGDL
jgi:hypothetical protein